TAPHREPPAAHGRRLELTPVFVASRIDRILAFDEEVLRVGVRVGEAPRDAVVVSDDEARDPREGEADELVAGAFQSDLVPDRWIPHGEVRIAGEDRLAACRPRAGEGPAVRADAVARSRQDRVERERAKTRRPQRDKTGEARAGALVHG